MATGTFFQTQLKNGLTTTLASPQVVVNTGGDPTLNVGDTFTIGGVVYTYAGLVTSVPAQGGGTTSGFYATTPAETGSGSNAKDTYIFTKADPANNVQVTTGPGDFIVCFLAGTRIATTTGQKTVEDLAIGDLVLTSSGAAVPVLWVGRQTVATLFGLRDADLPVCISAGALGEGLPARDLRVTSGHAMLIDGVLVNAGALVNGSTITKIARSELGEQFTVYHIETENHDIVLAEGAATETFVDNVSRARFDNFAEYQALFGAEDRPMQERPEPRAASARQVPSAIRARLAALVPDQAAAA